MAAPDKPTDRVQFIDARDLANFVLGLVEHRTVGTFNATSPPGMFTIGDVISASLIAAKAMASPNPAPTPVWIPADFLEKEKIQAMTDMPVYTPTKGEIGGLADVSVARALRLGLSIRPVQPTVNDTLAWYLQRPAEERVKLNAGLTPEREKALLEAWRART